MEIRVGYTSQKISALAYDKFCEDRAYLFRQNYLTMSADGHSFLQLTIRILYLACQTLVTAEDSVKMNL